MVAGVFELACLGQCSLSDKIFEVTGDGGSRCARDGDVILRAESSFEAVDAFSEHALDDLFLPLVQLAAQAVVELRLLNNELDALPGVVLSFQNGFGEVDQPACDVGVLVVAFEFFVVALPVSLDGVGQCNECRVSETLGE